jgi:hypothetical protein
MASSPPPFCSEYKQLTPMYYVGLGTILIANITHPVCVRMTRKPLVSAEG